MPYEYERSLAKISSNHLKMCLYLFLHVVKSHKVLDPISAKQLKICIKSLQFASYLSKNWSETVAPMWFVFAKRRFNLYNVYFEYSNQIDWHKSRFEFSTLEMCAKRVGFHFLRELSVHIHFFHIGRDMCFVFVLPFFVKLPACYEFND